LSGAHGSATTFSSQSKQIITIPAELSDALRDTFAKLRVRISCDNKEPDSQQRRPSAGTQGILCKTGPQDNKGDGCDAREKRNHTQNPLEHLGREAHGNSQSVPVAERPRYATAAESKGGA
jgi:hypothetical protein